MNLFERLTKLANDLDAKGLIDEATTLDDIVREAVDQNTNAVQALRQSLGLPPGPLNAELVAKIQKAYPGVWQPTMSLQQNLAAVMKQLEMTKQLYNDPRKQPFDIGKVPMPQ